MAKILDIKIAVDDLDMIIMKETTKFVQEYPEQVVKAQLNDSFSFWAFRILSNRIRKRIKEKL